MRKSILSVSLILVLLFGIAFGLVFQKYQFFPYAELKQTYTTYIAGKKSPYGPWAIGLYEGNSPFDLKPVAGVTNPILTGADVSDIDAKFVADPFFIGVNDIEYMFFEVLNRDSDQGDIGYAESADGINWDYKQIVIDEDFHLSYPYVFKWEDDYYMIPESYEDLSVRLYKADNFPKSWKYVGNLLSGYEYIDPSIIYYQNKWWLFVATKGNETLNVYYSDNLMGEWHPHKLNPIIRSDANYARPGGRMFEYNNKLYRICQDDYPSYGLQVYGFEILKLTPNEYEERIISDQPILTGTGEGWNKTGMHQLDVRYIAGRWLAVVDGHAPRESL